MENLIELELEMSQTLEMLTKQRAALAKAREAYLNELEWYSNSACGSGPQEERRDARKERLYDEKQDYEKNVAVLERNLAKMSEQYLVVSKKGAETSA